MIVTVGRITGDPAKREQVVEIAQRLARASRSDEGCLGYRVYEDTETPNDFVFVEEWESEAALRAHFATPHVAEFMGAIMGVIVGPPDVRFHTVAATMDLAQATGG